MPRHRLAYLGSVPDPRSEPARSVGAVRLLWIGLAIVLAAIAWRLPASYVAHPPLAPVSAALFHRIVLGASSLAALVWAVWGGKESIRVDPDDRLPRPPCIGSGSVRRPMVWLVGITLVGAALRLYGLGGELWYDEIQTLLRHVDRPALELVLWPGDRNVHLLYTLLLEATTSTWGFEEWAVRLPAAAFGIATIPAVYALGRTFLRSREALLAAALLAVSYHHVFFSQNARGYSSLVLFTTLSTTVLIRALREDRRRDWLAYVASAFLGVATTLHGGLVVAGQALALPFVALRLRTSGIGIRPLVGKATLAIGVTGLAALDLYGTALSGLLPVAARARERAVETGEPRPFWSELWTGLADGFGEIGLLALVVLAVPLLVGTIRVTRRHPMVVTLLVAPIATTSLAMTATGFHVFPRYFLWAVPVFALLVVGSVAALVPSARWLPAAVVAVLGTASAVALPTSYHVPKQPTRTSLAWVLETSDPGDVLVSDPETTPGVRFYLPRLVAGDRRRVEPVRSVEGLESIERAHPGARLWVLTTELDGLPLDVVPLRAPLAHRYRRVKTFPATIERMGIVVWLGPRRDW